MAARGVEGLSRFCLFVFSLKRETGTVFETGCVIELFKGPLAQLMSLRCHAVLR